MATPRVLALWRVLAALTTVAAGRRAPCSALLRVPRGGKSEHLFAGIENQGNTCYLNAVLQALYHVPSFRDAVLESAPPKKRAWWRRGRRAAPEALSSVFGSLLHNRTASTRALTRSLRVNPREQQDAHEYLRLLLDYVESVAVATYGGEGAWTLAVTPEEATRIGANITKLRRQSFLDVSLDLRPTLKLAIASALEPELLDDKWKTPHHGYRTATKTWKVDTLPHVLLLHLKRFGFDGSDVTKIGDPFDFPLEFNDYFGTGERYRLHAVIVHAGDSLRGHYYAFIDPQLDGRWFRFDDTKVSSVEVDDMLAEARGTRSASVSVGAYLLQYIRLPAEPPKPPPDEPSLQDARDDEVSESAPGVAEDTESLDSETVTEEVDLDQGDDIVTEEVDVDQGETEEESAPSSTEGNDAESGDPDSATDHTTPPVDGEDSPEVNATNALVRTFRGYVRSVRTVLLLHSAFRSGEKSPQKVTDAQHDLEEIAKPTLNLDQSTNIDDVQCALMTRGGADELLQAQSCEVRDTVCDVASARSTSHSSKL